MQLTYAMQFKGTALPGETPGVLKAQTKGPSCRITTTISDAGLYGSVEPAPGESAAFESTVTFTGPTSFLESGSIDFGGGNRLQFSTVGAGFIDDSAVAKLKHGSVIWKLDSGAGQFDGASGLIASNFSVDDAGQVVDNHLGVIFLK